MRIVSLLPSATELVGVLGLEDHLVAISHECDTPPSVLHLPKATGSRIPHGLSQSEINTLVAKSIADDQPLYTVNAELIRDLKPDLVLTQGLCDVCAVTPETIETTLRGIACTLPAGTEVLSLSGMSIEGIFNDLRQLAERTERGQHAEAAIRAAQNQLGQLSAKQTDSKLLLLEWVEPAYSPGHWVPEQIAAAGLVSAIGSPGEHSRALHWHEVEASNPDAIGVVCCGYDLEHNTRFAKQIMDLPELHSWFKGPIVAFDANRFFSRPTLAVIDGAKRIHEAFVQNETAGDGYVRIN